METVKTQQKGTGNWHGRRKLKSYWGSEDEELIREIILEMLTAKGFNAIGAVDGYMGVLLAQEFVPDLIVCDVRMPRLDGVGVLRTLRTDPITATIPFIFMTAQASNTQLHQNQYLGNTTYLPKPFKSDDLLKAIALMLD